MITMQLAEMRASQSPSCWLISNFAHRKKEMKFENFTDLGQITSFIVLRSFCCVEWYCNDLNSSTAGNAVMDVANWLQSGAQPRKKEIICHGKVGIMKMAKWDTKSEW